MAASIKKVSRFFGLIVTALCFASSPAFAQDELGPSDYPDRLWRHPHLRDVGDAAVEHVNRNCPVMARHNTVAGRAG